MRNWLNFITHERCKKQARIQQAKACQKVMEAESRNEILLETFFQKQIDSYAKKVKMLELELKMTKASMPPKP